MVCRLVFLRLIDLRQNLRCVRVSRAEKIGIQIVFQLFRRLISFFDPESGGLKNDLRKPEIGFGGFYKPFTAHSSFESPLSVVNRNRIRIFGEERNPVIVGKLIHQDTERIDIRAGINSRRIDNFGSKII